MAKLRREIGAMKQVRDTQRGARRRHEVPSVAIVGYTNAGSRPLLYAADRRRVLVEDRAVRHPRPSHPPADSADTGTPYTLTGHRRFRAQPAPPAGRGIPVDAGGDVTACRPPVHVVDASDRDPEGQITAVRRWSTRSVRAGAMARGCWSPTRSTLRAISRLSPSAATTCP